MTKQILTLDDLYQFFVQKDETLAFSSQTSGKPIVVATTGFFETADGDDMPGMLKLKLKVCHTETNRNGSHISVENMEQAMPTLKYRPILAFIHNVDGVDDFYAHNMEIIENEDGDTEVNYIEKQVGCFTADDPWLEYDSDAEKTYVMAYAVIPETYTEAADIIRRKNGTKVSCELVINELAYNAKEKYLDLTDFYFGGCTLLGVDNQGKEIGEGMQGARADIVDFCHEAPVFTYQDKLIETLEKLNITLESFNRNLEEGGDEEMDNVETVVVENSETAVDETPVEETVETNEEFTSDDSSASEDGDDIPAVEAHECNRQKQYSIDEYGNTKVVFEISHEDIRVALYNLLIVYEEEDNEWYFISNVYDDYFIYENWEGDKLYKQSYAMDGDNVELSGDRQQMFRLLLTESEKLALEKMREEYASLVQFKEDAEAAQVQAKKDEIFARPEFAGVVETKSFKSLIEKSKDYTIEECEQKANDILEDFKSFAANFAANDSNSRPKVIRFSVNQENSEEIKPYGTLFDNTTK